jgi:hypothetical protein
MKDAVELSVMITNAHNSDAERIMIYVAGLLVKKIETSNTVWIDFNPLMPELNPSAQRYLTRFLLGILILEPCISLIYT